MGERCGNLRLQFLRVLLAVGIEVDADVGRNREARRHRQAKIGHLGEVRALAAKEVAHVGFAVGLAVAEGIDPLAGLGSASRAGPRSRLGGYFFGFCDLASLRGGGFPVPLGLGFRLFHERLIDGLGH